MSEFGISDLDEHSIENILEPSDFDIRPFIESERASSEQKKQAEQATIEVAAMFQQLHARMDAEHEERIAYESKAEAKQKVNDTRQTHRFISNTILGILSAAFAGIAAFIAIMQFFISKQ